MKICGVEFNEGNCAICGKTIPVSKAPGPYYCAYCWEVKVIKYDTGKYGKQGTVKT
jgi:hypothetical protein